MMHRRTKTLLPTKASLLKPRIVDSDKAVTQLQKVKDRQASYYNIGARHLPPLHEGGVVREIPRQGETNWRKATIAGQDNIRFYDVLTEDVGQYRRNSTRRWPSGTDGSGATYDYATYDYVNGQTYPGCTDRGRASASAQATQAKAIIWQASVSTSETPWLCVWTITARSIINYVSYNYGLSGHTWYIHNPRDNHSH
jgi:hypothetical protein